ncbi:MAG: acyltransferase family protein, partial [Glaciihabitans sp.]
MASLAVVFTHVMLTSELFAGAALRGEMNAVPGSWEWMVTYTPLHLFWDGTAAVAIFFVLSGLVLTLPVLRFGAGKFSWRAYYPKRVLRLYLPVWGAVLFGTLLAVVVPRVNHSSVGSWLGSRPDPTPLGALEDAILIFGPSDVISPLWTLQWEVLFSLL